MYKDILGDSEMHARKAKITFIDGKKANFCNFSRLPEVGIPAKSFADLP